MLKFLTHTKKERQRKLLEMIAMMMVSLVLARIQTHLIAHVNYLQLFVYQVHLNET